MPEIAKFGKIIIANWKLHGSKSFIVSYLEKIRQGIKGNNDICLIICPPFPFIKYLEGANFNIGAQDCSIYDQGAYTGEVSAKILKELDCNFCIVGHSERRGLFKETNEIVLKKANNCLDENIIPILCIGENLHQKKANLTKDVLYDQIKKCVPENANENNLIIAYEPIWAIGTGLTPTIEDINDIHKFIKNNFSKTKKYKILYGGSVKSSNSQNILKLDTVNGILVGGSSIDIEEFNKIISY